MTRNLLTIGDVAKILRISRSTVYRLIKSGQISALRIGKLLRVSPANLERFIKMHLEKDEGRD